MTTVEVAALAAGDEVFWTDPDDGLCSRSYTIQTIRVTGDVVVIQEPDGSVLECFASELS